jgi:hypothetical protein
MNVHANLMTADAAAQLGNASKKPKPRWPQTPAARDHL